MTLASQWHMLNVVRLAKSFIASLVSDPIEMIQFQRKFEIEAEWAMDAYVKLVERKEPFSLKEAELIGLEGIVIVHRAKFAADVVRFSPFQTLTAIVKKCISEVYNNDTSECIDHSVYDITNSALQSNHQNSYSRWFWINARLQLQRACLAQVRIRAHG